MSNTYTSNDYKEIRAKIDQLLKNSHVTDEIHLSRESNSEIMDVWDFNRQTEFPDDKFDPSTLSDIPADLLIMNTVPIPDCRFEVDGWDLDITEGKAVDFRVCVFSKEDRIVVNNPGEPEFSVVGSLEILGGPNEDVRKYSIPFAIESGNSAVGLFGLACRIEDNNGDMQNLSDLAIIHYPGFEHLLNQFSPFAHQCLSTWYGTQICMLYPPIREQLSAPRITAESDIRKTSGKSKKRPLRYVKVHTINAEELKRLKYGDNTTRSFERKTYVWHVCGHYRKLQSGETIWVNPYDKGPGRNFMIPENRQRIIMTEGAKGRKKSLRNDSLPNAEAKSKNAQNKAKNQPSKKKLKRRNKANKNHASL